MAETVESGAREAGELLQLDPSAIVIGTNVRTDLRCGDKEFRRSIKERGVLEAVTVYRDDEGQYVLLRGQRRVLTAAEVGTPTGLVPARVVPRPEEVDRIGDQLVENLHRTDMRDSEIVSGVEQLTLLGVSAAQIAKRTALARPTVNAALAVAQGEQTRERVDSGELTLDEAEIFTEFESDPAAIERLERRKQWGQPLEHEAQRLRDEAAEREAYNAEVERLRGEGLPVLSAEEAAEAVDAPRLENMRTPEGEPVPAEDWPNVPGAAVIVTEDWDYPEPEHGTDTDDEDDWPEGVKVYRPTWVVTDVEASGLTHVHDAGRTAAEVETEAAREERRQERRRVIANNKAWASAETVRREWLAAFLARRSAPKGAEALICAAVVTGNHTLTRAMDHRHPMLCRLLGIETSGPYWGGHPELAELTTKSTTPKAATMTTLAAVVAAWEDSIGKQTWRNPTEWDARVLGALIEWGYQPSEVERLLLGESNKDAPAAEDASDDEQVDPAGDESAA
jgi:ParB family transcriptional regulator, chromosome partitioning protein